MKTKIFLYLVHADLWRKQQSRFCIFFLGYKKIVWLAFREIFPCCEMKHKLSITAMEKVTDNIHCLQKENMCYNIKHLASMKCTIIKQNNS